MKTKLILCMAIFISMYASANNMLVQNVTTTGNNPTNQTIQVQFDISWDNSWRDSINYDAAWIFIKFKDANGLWQHAKLNQTGFVSGAGTTDSIKVPNDKVGAWLYREGLGSGTFNSVGMQLQWNYGLSGLSTVTGLEIRVFAMEMVFVPEGEFNARNSFEFIGGGGPYFENVIYFNAPASIFPIIHNRLSPTLNYGMPYDLNISLKIKADAGIDTTNDGVVDITTYPLGYRAFYCLKFEMSDQQYADFLNTLTPTQIATVGVAGNSIYFSNGQYFSSNPNTSCSNGTFPPTDNRVLAYSDWSGLRPMSFLEYNKASYGPFIPGSSTVAFYVGSQEYWSSYYGILDLTIKHMEPVITLNSFQFNTLNGDGSLTSMGNHDVVSWSNSTLLYLAPFMEFNGFGEPQIGFRFVRSAE